MHLSPCLLPGFTVLFLSCQTTENRRRAAPDSAQATTHYVVLAQKALTYQADFQYEAWAGLLAEDVVYYPQADDSTARPLAGKADLLAYWRHWQDTSGIRAVRLSAFRLEPVGEQMVRPPRLADQPGVYVAAAYQRQLTYDSGEKVARPESLWLHFDDDQRIDRLYYFQPDDPPPQVAGETAPEPLGE